MPLAELRVSPPHPGANPWSSRWTLALMMGQEDSKGCFNSQRHRRAEEPQSNVCTSHPELKGTACFMVQCSVC